MATTIGEVLTVTPDKVTGFVNFIWYIIVGMVVAVIGLILLKKVYEFLAYNYHITVHRKVGDTTVLMEDYAKEVTEDNHYYLHYRKMNKMSPLWDSKFHYLAKKNFLFGLFPKTYIGITCYLHGKKIVPMEVHSNPGVVPYDMDLFNFMQSRIKKNIDKYMRVNTFLKLAPLIGIGLVVMMFIVGMVFYTKHIETISMNILNTASSNAQKIMEMAGVQVVK